MKPKNIWLSIHSSEMMRDIMKSFTDEIKRSGIKYTSYSSRNRVYLHLKEVPMAFQLNIDNWTYYNPITQLKNAPNISDYDIADW